MPKNETEMTARSSEAFERAIAGELTQACQASNSTMTPRWTSWCARASRITAPSRPSARRARRRRHRRADGFDLTRPPPRSVALAVPGGRAGLRHGRGRRHHPADRKRPQHHRMEADQRRDSPLEPRRLATRLVYQQTQATSKSTARQAWTSPASSSSSTGNGSTACSGG